MGYIPADAKWYLADIVLQIAVEDDPRLTVHTNVTLVRADSPEEAYAKANELGVRQEISYENPDGKLVAFTYRGLRDLKVIHEKLEHGAELFYLEDIDMDKAAVEQYVSSKEDLGVFADRKRPTGPNYMSKDVLRQMQEKFPTLAFGLEDKSKIQ